MAVCVGGLGDAGGGNVIMMLGLFGKYPYAEACKANTLVYCHVITHVIPHSDAGSITHPHWPCCGAFPGFRIECGMTCGSLRGRVSGCIGGNTASVLWSFWESLTPNGIHKNEHTGVLPRAHPRHPALGCGIHKTYLLGLAGAFFWIPH